MSDLGREIKLQRDANIENFTEIDLLREGAWVILCSGFREARIREYFDYISLCFCDWESALSITQAHPRCTQAALKRFGNERKLDAIVSIAEKIVVQGFLAVKQKVVSDPIFELQQFSYIGPITVWHLAKNLGLDVAKPDRHLARISYRLGFESAASFCEIISRATGEPVKVVDLIIWRYLADNPAERHLWM